MWLVDIGYGNVDLFGVGCCLIIMVRWIGKCVKWRVRNDVGGGFIW